MLPDFRVQNFRCFQDLELRGLGRVNLIVGPNGAGKSTLLEALSVYCDGGAPDTIWSLLKSRDELTTASTPLHIQIASLFHSRTPSRMTVGPCDAANEQVHLSVQQAVQAESGRGRLRLESEVGDQGELVWAYVVERAGRTRIFALTPAQMEKKRQGWAPDLSYVHTWPGEVSLDMLMRDWRQIAGFREEEHAIEAMRCLIPDLERIYVLQEPGQRPIVRIRRHSMEDPLPLRRFGDGALHLLELVTSLLEVEGGSLALLDEVDSRLHYSIHDDLWRVIFKVAKMRDLQVFATTHSYDCIRAFQRVAGADVETGAVIRLANRWGEVRGQVLNEADLEDVTRFGTEIR